jgi:hypothetical protein
MKPEESAEVPVSRLRLPEEPADVEPLPMMISPVETESGLDEKM